ncbi:hypothetical protein WA171_003482 [Blastocystis sp. BT1]
MGSNIRATMNNLKETGIYLLKAFTQTFIYEKYNVIMCGIITMCCLAYLFKSTYNYSFIVFLQVFICSMLLLDMVANIQTNDINYVLTTKYYADMLLIIMDMVIISLVFICRGYGIHLPLVEQRSI